MLRFTIELRTSRLLDWMGAQLDTDSDGQGGPHDASHALREGMAARTPVSKLQGEPVLYLDAAPVELRARAALLVRRLHGRLRPARRQRARRDRLGGLGGLFAEHEAYAWGGPRRAGTGPRTGIRSLKNRRLCRHGIWRFHRVRPHEHRARGRRRSRFLRRAIGL